MKRIIAILMLVLMLFSVSVSADKVICEFPEDVKVVHIGADNLSDFFDDLVIGETKEMLLRDNAYNEFAPVALNKSEEVSWLKYLVAREEEFRVMPAGAGYIGVLSAYGGVNFGALYDPMRNIMYYFKDCIIGSPIWPNGDVNFITLDYKGSKVDTFEYAFDATSITAKLKKFAYVTVKYNDELIEFDQNPVIEEGRTLVPLRAIFEKLGAEIAWDDATKTVTATKGDTVITLTIDNANATKNGEAIALDVPAKIISDRTMVPVRFIADSFGVNVEWDADARQVILTN